MGTWAGINCDWHEQPDRAAMKNAALLVEATRAAGFPPTCAATGRWLSVCLFWDHGRTEVEVFSNQFELYFLPRSDDDGEFDVEEFAADAPETLGILIEKIKEARSTLRE